MIRWARNATLLAALIAVVAMLFDVSSPEDLRLAGMAYNAGDMDQCLRLSSRALLLGGLDKEGRFRAHDLRAKAAVKLDNKSFAMSELDRALAEEPDKAQALLLRGELRLAAGDASAAMGDLDKGLSLAQTSGASPRTVLSPALVNRGKAQLALGRVDQAWQDAKRAVEMSPSLPRARLLASQVLDARGRPDLALDQVELAYALVMRRPHSLIVTSPENEEMVAWLVRMRMKNKVDPARPPKKLE